MLIFLDMMSVLSCVVPVPSPAARPRLDVVSVEVVQVQPLELLAERGIAQQRSVPGGELLKIEAPDVSPRVEPQDHLDSPVSALLVDAVDVADDPPVLKDVIHRVGNVDRLIQSLEDIPQELLDAAEALPP